MRIRALETAVGTVLVMDRVDPETAKSMGQSMPWSDQTPRPFVLATEHDVELPGVDPVELVQAVSSGTITGGIVGLEAALERARTGRASTDQADPDPGPEWVAASAVLIVMDGGMPTGVVTAREALDRVQNLVTAHAALRKRLDAQTDRRRSVQHELDRVGRELSVARGRADQEAANARAAERDRDTALARVAELGQAERERDTARRAADATESQSPKWQTLRIAAREAVQGVSLSPDHFDNGRRLLGALEDAVSAVED